MRACAKGNKGRTLQNKTPSSVLQQQQQQEGERTILTPTRCSTVHSTPSHRAHSYLCGCHPPCTACARAPYKQACLCLRAPTRETHGRRWESERLTETPPPAGAIAEAAAVTSDEEPRQRNAPRTQREGSSGKTTDERRGAVVGQECTWRIDWAWHGENVQNGNGTCRSSSRHWDSCRKGAGAGGWPPSSPSSSLSALTLTPTARHEPFHAGAPLTCFMFCEHPCIALRRPRAFT